VAEHAVVAAVEVGLAVVLEVAVVEVVAAEVDRNVWIFDMSDLTR